MSDGEGLVETFKNVVNKIVNKLSPVANNVINVVPTRTDFPPDVRDILNKYGGQTIASMRVGRSPVNAVIRSLLNVASFGEFNKKIKELGYDNIFHLFILITVADGTTLLLEKNQTIDVTTDYNKYNTGKETYFEVPINKSITLAAFIKNALDKVGPSIYFYDPVNNNCQNFIMDLLNSSGFLTLDLRKFIKQDVAKIFSTSPEYVHKLSSFLTNIAAKANRVIKGRGEGGDIDIDIDDDGYPDEFDDDDDATDINQNYLADRLNQLDL